MDPATPCVVCGVGHQVLANGLSGPCAPDYQCPAGTADQDTDPLSACVPCGPGFYQAFTGQSDCTPVTSPCDTHLGFWEVQAPTPTSDRMCTNKVQFCLEFQSPDQLTCARLV